MVKFSLFTALLLFWGVSIVSAEEHLVEADLLIVGGTESGCAAAVQAARMGVKRIVLVNDIEWLGGQFSAEALGAIDENRGHGYDGTVPIPRSGIFREVIDAIERKNTELYGVARPGNTRVITTSRPIVSEEVFRELLKPYEESGLIERFSNYSVQNVLTAGSRVVGVKFNPADNQPALKVLAKMTIDASDWGDVIQGSGAQWKAGPDVQTDYDEPSAPESVEFNSDMNPITWCMILEQQPNETLFSKPENYDEQYFTGKWGWIDEKFVYTSRRLVDGQGYAEIDYPDVLLINTPPVDYPLDVYPAGVAAALEATEQGASKKNIVAMTPIQRGIVFQDAQLHTLKFYYYLQQKFPKFRFMQRSSEFGTTNQLPPKPYLRESLRLIAKHVIREQEVLGFGIRSNYATTMFPDAVFSWQFELDFHPTHRSFTTDRGDAGPWEADFRGNRYFGRGGTGRCVFPLRALVPEKVTGLLAAQKNLGYTSIVGSSCRLHDQSIHAGQASGALAAVSIQTDQAPAEFYLQPESLSKIWQGLLEPPEGAPLAIWPFADVDPFDVDFVAIQQLALRRALPLYQDSTAFHPDKPATAKWLIELENSVRSSEYKISALEHLKDKPRRSVVAFVWKEIQGQPAQFLKSVLTNDADGDGIINSEDALPFTPGEVTWARQPHEDGVPEFPTDSGSEVRAFNFTTDTGAVVKQFKNDFGGMFSNSSGFGWQRDLTSNTRLRNVDKGQPRDSFVFTREQDVWECEVPNGSWKVCVCLGDIQHEQVGQNLTIEESVVAKKLDTSAGNFVELETEVDVQDGRLTLILGTPTGGSNTCVNWIWLMPSKTKK